MGFQTEKMIKRATPLRPRPFHGGNRQRFHAKRLRVNGCAPIRQQDGLNRPYGMNSRRKFDFATFKHRK
jgi:hypothetical protein